jgi:uncharacterized protein YjbJ (UPF0337 family)
VGEQVDKAVGKAKQAVGDVTDDPELRREGKRDEMAGKAKGAVDTARDKLGEAIDKARDKAH